MSFFKTPPLSFLSFSLLLLSRFHLRVPRCQSSSLLVNPKLLPSPYSLLGQIPSVCTAFGTSTNINVWCCKTVKASNLQTKHCRSPLTLQGSKRKIFQQALILQGIYNQPRPLNASQSQEASAAQSYSSRQQRHDGGTGSMYKFSRNCSIF